MNKQLTPFQKLMEEHLIKFKEENQYIKSVKQRDKIYYPDISDGLFPNIKYNFLQYAIDNSIPYHDYANHVRSSQIFCINLFYPLIRNESELLLNYFSNLLKTEFVSIERFEFEYSPETDLLGEWRSIKKQDEYVTASDLGFFLIDKQSKRTILLLEIKFTEMDFTRCGGYDSNGNKNQFVCNDVNLLLADYNTCYLQTPLPRKSPRTYFNKFIDLNNSFSNIKNRKEKDCPFKSNLQCLRNHSFLKALVENKDCDNAFFLLVYHDKNEDILNEWTKYYDLLSQKLKNDLILIKASDIVKLSYDNIYRKYFLDRYKLS